LFLTSNAAMAQTEIAAQSAWSPYLVGALIGLLVCVSLVVANKPIGASSAYSVMAGIIGKKLAPAHTHKLNYYRNHSTKINWSLVFVLGIVLGSFVAAALGGELTGRFLPPLWVSEFGEQSHYLRLGVSFVGGILLAFGARLAGGCTSGHGISGALQLSVGSWLALISFFIGGVIAANLMFG
jgi:hypothetical protein